MRQSTRRGLPNPHRRGESSDWCNEVNDMKSHLLATGVLSLGLLTTGSTPALAHHGNAAYADTITEFKQATVTQFAWANPHALINFDAKDASGKVVHMVVETAAPQAL